MTQPSKDHQHDYAKTDAQLYGYDGSKWQAASVDGDGNLATKLYAWNVDTLSFVPVACDSGGNFSVASPTYTVRSAESGEYTYFGKAAPGSLETASVWQVFRIDADGTLLFAGGTAGFTNRWDQHLTATYS